MELSEAETKLQESEKENHENFTTVVYNNKSQFIFAHATGELGALF